MKLEQATKALMSDKVIGWREHVGLPELGIALLQAKIDTGARTSALHAIDLQPFVCEGERWISFHVPHRGRRKDQRQSAKILDEREIRNTSGVPEMRYVISTKLALGRRHWRIEVSLADREQMKFDLILGRTAIRRHKLLVAPGKSFLVGMPKF